MGHWFERFHQSLSSTEPMQALAFPSKVPNLNWVPILLATNAAAAAKKKKKIKISKFCCSPITAGRRRFGTNRLGQVISFNLLVKVIIMDCQVNYFFLYLLLGYHLKKLYNHHWSLVDGCFKFWSSAIWFLSDLNNGFLLIVISSLIFCIISGSFFLILF